VSLASLRVSMSLLQMSFILVLAGSAGPWFPPWFFPGSESRILKCRLAFTSPNLQFIYRLLSPPSYSLLSEPAMSYSFQLKQMGFLVKVWSGLGVLL
jgi:hypothetical protein